MGHAAERNLEGKKATDPGLNTDPGDSHARTTPYISGDRIIFGYDSVIECLNKNTGERIWTFASDPYWNGQTKPFWDATDFIIENNKLYALMGESKVVCLDLETGNKLWLFDTKVDQAGRGFCKYSHSPDAVFITLYNLHYMIAISKSSGTELWRTRIPFPDFFPKVPEAHCDPGPATYSNGKVYCGFGAQSDTAREGGLIAFDAITGKLLFFQYPSVRRQHY